MSVSLEQARAVAVFCIDEYFGKKPYDDYVNGVAISLVNHMKPEAPNGEDHCVSVMLREELPPDLSIPNEKDGVKIYTEVVEEYRAD